jgi:hypothetical protein
VPRVRASGTGGRSIGLCPVHGRVTGVKELPSPSFPFAVYAVRRARAAPGQYRCSECAQPLTPLVDISPAEPEPVALATRNGTPAARTEHLVARRRPNNTRAAVCVRGLQMSYEGVEAVAGIDLEVDREEEFAFLGPNGAGKTTTVEIWRGIGVARVGWSRFWEPTPAPRGEDWRARIGVGRRSRTRRPSSPLRSACRCTASIAAARTSPGCWTRSPVGSWRSDARTGRDGVRPRPVLDRLAER